MTIQEITDYLETWAPVNHQEDYDNAGLITGSGSCTCTGVIISLDATEAVVTEAIEKKCNLVIAHHPLIFKGLKKINGSGYVERTVIRAIKNDIAIYAIHTNLDNVIDGVNGKMADVIGLINRAVLDPRLATLKKLYTFVPVADAEPVRQAIFAAGAGEIGNYSECSFHAEGTGTYKAGPGTNPYAGKQGERHHEPELKIEVVFPAYLEQSILNSLLQAHPYEEVAYDVAEISNNHPAIGSGIIGELEIPLTETEFLTMLKQRFNTGVIRHTHLLNKPVRTIAVCGGSGSFLISKALAAKADVFVTADLKYHEFFDADNRMIITDIGHFESEQFTTDLIYEKLQEKISSFALLKTEVNTNPVRYFPE